MTDDNSLMCSLIVSGATQPSPLLPFAQLQTGTNRHFDENKLVSPVSMLRFFFHFLTRMADVEGEETVIYVVYKTLGPMKLLKQLVEDYKRNCFHFI